MGNAVALAQIHHSICRPPRVADTTRSTGMVSLLMRHNFTESFGAPELVVISNKAQPLDSAHGSLACLNIFLTVKIIEAT